ARSRHGAEQRAAGDPRLSPIASGARAPATDVADHLEHHNSGPLTHANLESSGFMKRAIIVVVILAAAGAGVWYSKRGGENANAASNTPANQGRGGRQGGGPGGGGFGGPGGPFGCPGGGGPRQPMTVEVASVKRADMTESLTVVGNLIGAATVEAVPKVSGRLDDVTVRLGDRVRKGQ